MPEVKGTVKVKNDTVVVSEKFRKRDFVVTIDETTPYPQHVSFQATQDKCDVLDNINVGDVVNVSYNLNGREWNGPTETKYFNTLVAWQIKK